MATGAGFSRKKSGRKWGKGIVEQLSLDLQNEFPDEKGFSARNLWNMKNGTCFIHQAISFQKWLIRLKTVSI